MNYKVLYRKYRPNSFKEVVDRDNIVEILKQSIINNKTAHAYIFTGVRGTGKTSLAKIFAKTINCLDIQEGEPCNKCENCLAFETSPDIIEIDAASNNGVDEMRELVSNSRLVPSSLQYKVYIIDEVHMLSSSAYNALLKTLEEPVSHVKFILATTEIHKVPLTILSRCQRFDFFKISTEKITEHLVNVSKKEKIKIDKKVLKEIAELSDGSLRDALGILDQLSNNEEKVELEDLEKTFSYISSDKIDLLLKVIEEGNINLFLEEINNLIKIGTDVNMLINKMINKLKEEIYGLLRSNNLKIEYNKDLILLLIESQKSIKSTTNPYLLIEINILSFILEKQGNKLTKKEEMSTKVYIKKEEDSANVNKVNIDKDENIEQKTKNKVEQEKEPIEKEENIKDYNLELKKVRINNCFAGASKEIKNEMVSHWKEFIDNLQDSNAQLFSMTEHSKVEAASKKYLIVSAPVNGAIKLLVDQTEEIEKAFKTFSGTKIKLCFLTDTEWEIEKNEYIDNIKNNIKYIEVEEPKTPKKNQKAADMAIDLFGEDSIDIR
ncbi:MAG: DNA polymerase III subunit gamma/tau [Mollicutes bacterium]|nr:DNA polymerase III subunit gamma/tau [Mollicutes bacterium]